MNERIQELWKKSQQRNGSDDGRGGFKILESVEKFAELIVRECVSIADEYDGVGSTIVGRIEKHFGVEE